MAKQEKPQFPGFAGLAHFPPEERWNDWTELDPKAWPRRVEKHYDLVPTVCFNCEAACGLMAFVDKESGEIRKFEGHPLHPASRGRNCAKGPATASQVTNPDRILYPLRRTGERGAGGWERVSWDAVLDDIAGRIRKALVEERRDQVVYHVGRPGEDMYTERVLQCWGVDGHNSHTNVCSAGARTGYSLWMGSDRPNPDHANARFILMLSSHLEAGHYFNPQAQRIIEAKLAGTKIAVVDTRLSNTAARGDWWLSPWPGTEAAMLLAMANLLISSGNVNREYVRRWVNWQQLLQDRAYLEFMVARKYIAALPTGDGFDDFLALLAELYQPFTPEWAQQECGVAADDIRAIAAEIGKAGTAFASHIWRNAAAGHKGGWMITRCLFLLHVLTGSVGTKGGCLPNSYGKFVPTPHTHPTPIKAWNETHWPKEFPLSHFEMSFCLPHLMEKNDHSLDVYFTRVYNPVWTNPDGFSWIEMFKGNRIGLHVALTPTWSETAQYADYVLPMGLGPERHDLHSYETHASQWLGFRQPVQRVVKERHGEKVEFTYEANPGEVWEENEFWIELSWRIDPDGSLGVRQHFESPYRAGQKIALEEYYRWIFENSVPGLPAAAESKGMTPLEYMRHYGVYEVSTDVYSEYERPVAPPVLAEAAPDGDGLYSAKAPPKVNFRPWPGPFKDASGRFRVGVQVDGEAKQGFPTPSGKLEFFSPTLRDWGWPEYAIPIYPRSPREYVEMPEILSQVHPSLVDRGNSEFMLLPTFRLPTLIHTRTNGAKWLYEIAHQNPIWLHPSDAQRLGVQTGDLVRMESEIGHLVDRVFVTEAIKPGVVACSHHLGRWRQQENEGSDRWNSALVKLQQDGNRWKMDQLTGVTPFKSKDPDSSRIWWREGGVHQNLIFPVQPDPISGQHCWHQKVRVVKAAATDRYGDIAVDTARSRAAFQRWLTMCRPARRGGERRPYWLMRPLKPHPDFYKLPT